MNKNGDATAIDTIQMALITALVRCFVIRTCNGKMMAMKRSQDMAESVKTLEVKQVTKQGKEEKRNIYILYLEASKVVNLKYIKIYKISQFF